ncbi:MAG: TauD/TfdA family dioxygenase [Wenzhouxiangellaceae bacterium]|nr:TauD/TfdA family dioxygenase [Wenzhouxiangellaceae bacterium]
MSTLQFASVAGQQTDLDSVFPQVIAHDGSCKDAEAVARWIGDHREQLEQQVKASGVLLLRGFPLATAEDFDQASRAFGYPNFTYKDSLSNAVRINHTERVFTANEAPPHVEINMHNEMAQTPIYPERILFFCASAAEQGGATPVCRCDRVYNELCAEDPDLVAALEEKGVRYTTWMPAANDASSGQGRSWRDTLSVEDVAGAEEKLQRLGYDWEWLDDGRLRATTPALPAVIALDDGRKVFFNQLVAAYLGWEGVRDNPSRALRFGDGSEIPKAGLERIAACVEAANFDLQWQDGDLAIVNNYLAMHGRRPYGGTRKRTVLVVLGAARENRLKAA